MFGAVSIATLSAGGLLNNWGWRWLNLATLPFLALVFLMVLVLSALRRRDRFAIIAG